MNVSTYNDFLYFSDRYHRVLSLPRRDIIRDAEHLREKENKKITIDRGNYICRFVINCIKHSIFHRHVYKMTNAYKSN